MFALCRCGLGLLRVTGSKLEQNACRYICVAYIYQMKIVLESRSKYSSKTSSKNNLEKLVCTKIIFEHINHKNDCKTEIVFFWDISLYFFI